MNLYVTTAEIKSFMSISGSTQDNKIAMFNKAATQLLNGYLGVSDLALHKVTEEVHNASARRFRLRDLHVSSVFEIMNDEDEYTQTEPLDIEQTSAGLNYVLNLENYLMAGERKAKISYVAGWNASGMVKITVTVAGMSPTAALTFGAVSVDGFTVTRGTDWTAQATDAAEATAIAAAIDSKTGTRAFAVENVVYVIEDTNAQVITRTVSTTDATKLVLSDSYLRGVDFPEDIRLAIMTNVSSMMQFSKNPRLKSYTVGQKTVTFASKAEADSYEQFLRPYVRARVLTT
jgi:hypothetical protein